MQGAFGPQGQSDDITKRIVELRTAIENDPMDMDSHGELVGLLVQTGRIDDAIRAGKHALTIEDDWRVRFNLSSAYMAVQNPTAALPHIVEAVNLNPSKSNCYAMAGACLIVLGQLEDAETMLREGLECGDEKMDFHVYSNLAFVLMHTKRLTEARELMDTAMESAPEDAATYINASSVYGEMGQKERALELAEKAVELAPEHPLAMQNLELKRVQAGLSPREP